MEKAKRNVMINKAGGTSGKNTKNYRISIPVGMIKALGVTEEDRSVVLEEKDGVITIKKEKKYMKQIETTQFLWYNISNKTK